MYYLIVCGKFVLVLCLLYRKLLPIDKICSTSPGYNTLSILSKTAITIKIINLSEKLNY